MGPFAATDRHDVPWLIDAGWYQSLANGNSLQRHDDIKVSGRQPHLSSIRSPAFSFSRTALLGSRVVHVRCIFHEVSLHGLQLIYFVMAVSMRRNRSVGARRSPVH